MHAPPTSMILLLSVHKSGYLNYLMARIKKLHSAFHVDAHTYMDSTSRSCQQSND